MTLFFIYFHNWLRNKYNIKTDKRKEKKRKKGEKLRNEDADLKSETVLA